MRRMLLGILAALCLAGCGAEPAPQVQVEPLMVHAIKAGKADAFVLSCAGQVMILDTAEDEDGHKILEILEEMGETEAEVLLISHFDKDHVGGADQVLKSLRVGTVIDPDYEADSKEYRQYEEALIQADVTRVRPDETQEFELGDAVVRVYPSPVVTQEDNDRSLIVTVTHGNKTFLFPGDAEKELLTQWLTEHKEKFDFLKAPHHGNWNSVSKIFYLTVEPEICVLTDSDKNPADSQVHAVLGSLGTQTYSTKNGTIVFECDGNEIRVK